MPVEIGSDHIFFIGPAHRVFLNGDFFNKIYAWGLSMSNAGVGAPHDLNRARPMTHESSSVGLALKKIALPEVLRF